MAMKRFLKYICAMLLVVLLGCQSSQQGNDGFAPLPSANNQSIEKQIQFITDQISNGGQEADFYLQRAKLYCQLTRYRTAMRDLEVASGLGGESASLKYWKAVVLMGLKDYPNALRLAQEASKGRDDGEINLLLGQLYYLNGDNNEAFFYLDKTAQILTGEPLVAYYRGMVLLGRGDTTAGMQGLERAIQLDSSYKEAYIQRMGAALQTGNTTDVLNYASKALGNNLIDERIYILIGKSLSLNKKADSAAIYYQKALQLQPAAWEASYALAQHYFKKADYLQAERYYKDALDYNPNVPGGYFQMGFMYEYYLIRLNDALLAYQKGFNLQRGNEDLQKAIYRVERKIAYSNSPERMVSPQPVTSDSTRN